MAPLFFWRPTGPHGFLSQWYPCTFTTPSPCPPTTFPSPPPTSFPQQTNTSTSTTSLTTSLQPPLTFTSTEQYMMYRKAQLFHSPTLASQILSTSDPRKQQALGKKVPGFDGEVWDQEKSGIVEEGNWWKFVGGDLRGRLLGTGGRELVEASPRDRIWGIGFAAEGAEKRRGEWGENLLGKALMRVRERLREEEKGKGEGEGS